MTLQHTDMLAHQVGSGCAPPVALAARPRPTPAEAIDLLTKAQRLLLVDVAVHRCLLVKCGPTRWRRGPSPRLAAEGRTSASVDPADAEALLAAGLLSLDVELGVAWAEDVRVAATLQAGGGL